MSLITLRRPLTLVAMLVLTTAVLRAHSGPPFPIVSNQGAGPYVVSVWTDPDTTDDGTPGGQFWVMAKRAGSADDVPATTRAVVTIRPKDREGMAIGGAAEPVDGDVGRQFVSVVMDHEGLFGVHVEIDGPLGKATVEAEVEATYDTRPPPIMLLVYLVPFVLVGWLWMRAIRRRGRHAS